MQGEAMATTRRRLLKGGAAVAVAGSFRPSTARAADVLTIAAYGGEFQELFAKHVVEPFEKKFSVKVIYDNSSSQTQMYAKIRAGRGTAPFDVAAEMTAGQIILGAREKLLAEITEREVPNLKYVWDQSRTLIPPYGIVQNYQYLALIWNKNEVKQPTSWLDYWEAPKTYGEKVKGHLLSHGMSNYELAAYALIMAARSRGGDERHMDAAWDMLRTVKPYFGAVVDTSAAAVPYMENQQIWLGPYWSARSQYYINRGFPLGMTIPKEGTVSLGTTSAVPIGCKNKKLAFEFLNFRLDPEIQRNFCLAYFISPGRRDITDWPDAFREAQVTTEERMRSLVFPDLEYLAGQQRAWTEKWQEIMAS
jgi:putative spermidine/putrescine transport system substrate-binding protein